MSLLSPLIGPIAKIIDKIIPDKEARDLAKLELLKLESSQEMEQVRIQMSAILAEAQSTDPWTSRARPSFLYVMYFLLLWSIPMGLIAAVRPEAARDIASGMNAYLAGIPEPLYALFGTGYLGYTVARQWGKIRGAEK
ncbi:holin family protein [Parasphingorhabdus cellanae]|uniref:Holin family protein n=1 Tax=Parasphingorhabdus cellanae TaxID=2806553 RepID=A0ABX7T4S7_9SPHN|nr:holin family protein [Parasphingorhabdus cellanae]QTD55805.1 holin family protein [Parasphingorhabdus cellanae]